MCEAKSQPQCRALAVRYRFVKKRLPDGEFELLYLAHKVIQLECDPPTPKEGTPDPEPEQVIAEVDVDFLRSLDPKEWKKQDHYQVLGIEKLRHQANDETIKTAYRKVVLKHHPDKRKALGEDIKPDDDYYTCITMAYDILGNPTKRRSYDSVDPEFDDSLPSSGEIKKDFYKAFKKYFDLNARWSEKRRVPKLGGEDASRQDVERFYSFWYDFKSWREYSYEDEEERDKCSDRDERRYVDKINKAERLRKKKEEMSRIRQLVDMAYNSDPRIAKFKQEDKDKKLAAKRAKQSAVQAKKEEEERILREAQQAKERAEAAERAKIEAKRQEREAQKKAIKKERKAFREICKSNDNYASNPDDNLRHLTAIERICEALGALELEELTKNIRNNGKNAFMKAVKESEERVEAEKRASLETYQQKISQQVKNNIAKVNPEWTQDNVQLLVKAVNLFPAGTNQRWEVVANFINQHGTFQDNTSKFTAKLVLAKAKDMQSTDFSRNNLKEAANNQAFDNFIKEKKSDVTIKDSEMSTNIEVMTNGVTKEKPLQNGNSHTNNTKQNKIAKEPKENSQERESKENAANAWTTTEQQLLEQALKTYPASTPERWDRIADCIPARSKKDCMRRYKELVETIKAKKAAQATVAAK